MNTFNFNQPNGFPLTTDVLDNMQKAYLTYNQLLNFISTDPNRKNIIVGCENTGGYVNNGYVCIGNEILPFKGGSVQTYVHIQETYVKREFENGKEKNVDILREVVFGESDVNYKWEDFKVPYTFDFIQDTFKAGEWKDDIFKFDPAVKEEWSSVRVRKLPFGFFQIQGDIVLDCEGYVPPRHTPLLWFTDSDFFSKQVDGKYETSHNLTCSMAKVVEKKLFTYYIRNDCLLHDTVRMVGKETIWLNNIYSFSPQFIFKI